MEIKEVMVSACFFDPGSTLIGFEVLLLRSQTNRECVPPFGNPNFSAR